MKIKGERVKSFDLVIFFEGIRVKNIKIRVRINKEKCFKSGMFFFIYSINIFIVDINIRKIIIVYYLC